MKKKNKIAKNLETKDWKKVQEDFEDAFKNESENFKSQLISNIEESSKNIKIHYDHCYDILDEFYSEKCQRGCNLFKDHISNSFGGDDNIEKTMQQLFDDIITDSKSATKWNGIKNFFGWLHSKISSEEYLSKTVDFIINKISTNLKNFRDNIKEHIDKYKNNLNNEIKSSKYRVVAVLEEKKEEEELKIKIANDKNEKERKKWEEEKRILDEKKKKWEEICKKYRILRDEITSFKLGGE